MMVVFMELSLALLSIPPVPTALSAPALTAGIPAPALVMPVAPLLLLPLSPPTPDALVPFAVAPILGALAEPPTLPAPPLH